MTKSDTFLLDAGVAAGLVLALFIVIVLDKVVPTAKPPAAESTPIVTTTVTEKEPEKARPLRLAVTPTQSDEKNGKWDDMGKLLGHLGEGYPYTMFPLQDLYDPQKLAAYDVLFLTCAAGDTEDAKTGNLRTFVGNGGTLYASDWRYDCVAKAFPEYTVPMLAGMGNYQTLVAKVEDAGLRDLVGPTIPLKFNLSKWKTAAFGGDRVNVLIDGQYEKLDGGRVNAPFLVKFQFGKGTVIFTSFHNERQNSEVELKLLKYLVFSAVTAKTEAQVTQTMVKGGFSPQKSNLLSASADSPKVSQTYRSKKGGRIRFVLGFENRGARLRLTVNSPDGKTYQQEGAATFTVEVPAAPVGDWRYTVTALQVPYPDFPFTLTVGESD
jgi:hypothetical protein